MKFCLTLSFLQPEQLCEIAEVAEASGFGAISVSDHLVHPERIEARYPYGDSPDRMWDPTTPWPDVWVSTAMMAAVTQRMEFIQSVYILPMRDPFHVAKSVGTLAIMSGHRIHLGIGLGWMFDEFAVVGAPFERRGARADEMVEVMRKLWTGELVEHHGEFYDFEPLSMAPGVGRNVPIVVGGVSEAAMRRAARIGDGWAPAYLHSEGVRRGIETIRGYRREYGRSSDDELVVFTTCTDATDLDGYRRARDIGITHLMTTPWLQFEGKVDFRRLVEGLPQSTLLDGIKRFGDEVIARF